MNDPKVTAEETKIEVRLVCNKCGNWWLCAGSLPGTKGGIVYTSRQTEHICLCCGHTMVHKIIKLETEELETDLGEVK